MSSNLIRRIAAVLVATVIPFGAAASSAHAAAWSPQAQAQAQASVVSAGDDAGVGFTTYSLGRSSWS
jgi:hypothetical protein